MMFVEGHICIKTNLDGKQTLWRNRLVPVAGLNDPFWQFGDRNKPKFALKMTLYAYCFKFHPPLLHLGTLVEIRNDE